MTKLDRPPIVVASHRWLQTESATTTSWHVDILSADGTRMDKRPLGSTGLEVAPLAFGGNVFGWTVDEATSFRLLDAFIGAGFNLIDTADSYSRWLPGHVGGVSETIIGRWIAQRGRHDDVVIATIDVYQSHWDDEKTPQDETLEAYSRLVQQGKVRAIGASNFTAPRLAQALEVSWEHGYPRYATLQPHYNLCERARFEGAVQEMCGRERRGVIPYFSLAAGFLTGKYRTEADFAKSERGGGMRKYLNPRGLRILAALDAVAARCRATPAQVALAWLMARPGVTAPIASATSLAQLGELIAATHLQLDADALKALEQASAPA